MANKYYDRLGNQWVRDVLGNDAMIESTRVSVGENDFYCIVCDDVRTGKFIADVEIGGWMCAHHTAEEISKRRTMRKGGHAAGVSDSEGE